MIFVTFVSILGPLLASEEDVNSEFNKCNLYVVKFGAGKTCGTLTDGCGKFSTVASKLTTVEGVPYVGVAAGGYVTSEVTSTISTSATFFGYQEETLSEFDSFATKLVMKEDGFTLTDPPEGASEISFTYFSINMFGGTFITSSASSLTLTHIFTIGSTRVKEDFVPLTVPVISILKGKLLLQEFNGGAFKISNAPFFKIAAGASVDMTELDVGEMDREGGDGCVIEAVLAKDCTLAFQDCQFSECSADTGNGGAVAITVIGKGTLQYSLRNTEWSSDYNSLHACTASGNGGGLYLNISTTETPTLDFSGLTFSATCHAGNQGHAVYVLSSSDTHKSIEHWQPLILSSTNGCYDNWLVYASASSSSSSLQMADLIPGVTVSGSASECTQQNAQQCKTLHAAATVAIPGGGFIMIDSGVHNAEDESTELGGDFFIRGSSLSTPSASSLKLTQLRTPVFSITSDVFFISLSFTLLSGPDDDPSPFFDDTGSLTFINSVITGGASSVELSTSVIAITEANLCVYHTSISNITLTASPLIELITSQEQTPPHTSIYVADNTLFENIKRNSGDGSVFQLSTYGSVRILGTTFRKCVCSKGNGGAIAASYPCSGGREFRLGYTDEENAFADYSVSFDSCTASGNGGAIYIFIDGSSNDDFMYMPQIWDQLKFTSCSAATEKGLYAVIQSDIFKNFYPSLTFWAPLLLHNPSNDGLFLICKQGTTTPIPLTSSAIPQKLLVVGEGGSEEMNCGTEENGCASLSAALLAFGGLPSQIDITAAALTETDTEIPIPNAVTISGPSNNAAKTVVAVNIACDEHVYSIDAVNALVTFHNITFKCTKEESDADTDYLFFCGEFCALKLTYITITPSTAASLTLTRELVYPFYGKITLEYCDISSFTALHSGVIGVCPYKDYFHIRHSSFTSLVRSSGGGAVLQAAVGHGCTLDITNTTFDSCSSTTGNGGALNLILYQGGQVALKTVKFKKCTAGKIETKLMHNDDEACKGGAVYMEFQGLPSAVTLESISVSECAASGEGGGDVLYVQCSQDDQPPERFWQEMMAGVEGVDEGQFVAVHMTDTGSTADNIELSTLPPLPDEEPEDAPGAGGDDSEKSQSPSKSFPAWAIALIAVAGVAIIAGAVVAVVAVVCCSHPHSKTFSNTQDASEAPKTQTLEVAVDV